MAYRNRYVANTAACLFDAPQEDSGFVPSEEANDFFGPDETQYWSQYESDRKAKVKQERAAPKVRSKTVDKLDVEVLEWNQPDDLDTTLLNDIEAAHKQARPITYTVVNPTSKPSDPATKKRIFKNLHAQLQKEVQRAAECGTWMMLDVEIAKDARVHADKQGDQWEDVEMALFEPRIRDIVKALIAKRREVAVM